MEISVSYLASYSAATPVAAPNNSGTSGKFLPGFILSSIIRSGYIRSNPYSEMIRTRVQFPSSPQNDWGIAKSLGVSMEEIVK